MPRAALNLVQPSTIGGSGATTVGSMAAAADRRVFEFNKFGSIGRAAGFLLVTTGFMVRAIVRDFEGPATASNIVAQISPLGLVLFTGLLVGFGTVLVRALLTPKTSVTVTEDEVVLRGPGPAKRIKLVEICGVAAYDRPTRFSLPGRRAKGTANRVIVVLSDGGRNLDPVPKGVQWLPSRRDKPDDGSTAADPSGLDALVDEILADTEVLSQLPDDEFGSSMRAKLGGSPSARIKRMTTERPETRAMIIPLRGMPYDTEEHLRATLPEWL